MTLYCDPKVMFGGVAVGGIRISHMTHIDRDVTVALTTTRSQRRPFTVKPLKAPERSRARPGAPATRPQADGPPLSLADRADAFLTRVWAATTLVKMDSLWAASEGLRADLDADDPDLLAEVAGKFDAKRAGLAGDDGEPPA
jgi:hypothetical protein